MFVANIEQLNNYIAKLQRSRELVLISPLFTLMEQEELASIYDWLIAIAENKALELAKNTQVNDAEQL